jgi:hypothetical protein
VLPSVKVDERGLVVLSWTLANTMITAR